VYLQKETGIGVMMNRIKSEIDGFLCLGIPKTTPNVEKRMVTSRYLIPVSAPRCYICLRLRQFDEYGK